MAETIFIPIDGMELDVVAGAFVARFDGREIPAEMSDEVQPGTSGVYVNLDEAGKIIRYVKAVFLADM
jgi:hypothetical protein